MIPGDPPPDRPDVRWGLDGGRWMPATELTLGLDDYDAIQGSALTERLRTYGGRLHRVDAHLARLEGSCRAAGAWPEGGRAELAEALAAVAEAERRRLPDGPDFGVLLVVLPGRAGGGGPPRVMVRPYDLDFAAADRLYCRGDRLVVCRTVRQVPPECWPAHVKCRSRMHYHLADVEARRTDPAARGVLLHLDGTVAEAGIANLIVVDGRGEIVCPPRGRTLPGVSLATARDLAGSLGLTWRERDLTEADLAGATEILLTSTGAAVWWAATLDGRPVGTGRPGPVWGRLIGAWSAAVGVDLPAQAARHVGGGGPVVPASAPPGA